EVVTESVPRQLAGHAMILMQIGPLVREDHVRRQFAFQLLKKTLYLCAVVGKVSVTEVFEDHTLAGNLTNERVRALTGLYGALGLSGQHDPTDLRNRSMLDQPEDSPPTPDLDVVRMGSDREQPKGLVA